ncbi:MAG: hypothetical protein LWX51_17535 [Deltaproteobacteria bacterium]|jgi:hypothetical protein|nr:hypothetical protein [Deltaproteobacteria bacterium]
MALSNYYAPTEQELSGAPPKVLYELQMFRASVARCVNGDGNADPVLHNISLEATLLHARNLLDFFCGKKTKDDDIRAAHFLQESETKWWKSSQLEYLAALKKDLNYSINHLTYRRVQGKPRWDLVRISRGIEAAFKEFIARLPDNEQMAWILEDGGRTTA